MYYHTEEYKPYIKDACLMLEVQFLLSESLFADVGHEKNILFLPRYLFPFIKVRLFTGYTLYSSPFCSDFQSFFFICHLSTPQECTRQSVAASGE